MLGSLLVHDSEEVRARALESDPAELAEFVTCALKDLSEPHRTPQCLYLLRVLTPVRAVQVLKAMERAGVRSELFGSLWNSTISALVRHPHPDAAARMNALLDVEGPGAMAQLIEAMNEYDGHRALEGHPSLGCMLPAANVVVQRVPLLDARKILTAFAANREGAFFYLALHNQDRASAYSGLARMEPQQVRRVLASVDRMTVLATLAARASTRVGAPLEVSALLQRPLATDAVLWEPLVARAISRLGLEAVESILARGQAKESPPGGVAEVLASWSDAQIFPDHRRPTFDAQMRLAIDRLGSKRRPVRETYPAMRLQSPYAAIRDLSPGAHHRVKGSALAVVKRNRLMPDRPANFRLVEKLLRADLHGQLTVEQREWEEHLCKNDERVAQHEALRWNALHRELTREGETVGDLFAGLDGLMYQQRGYGRTFSSVSEEVRRAVYPRILDEIEIASLLNPRWRADLNPDNSLIDEGRGRVTSAFDPYCG
jgi:hypothetical protein